MDKARKREIVEGNILAAEEEVFRQEVQLDVAKALEAAAPADEKDGAGINVSNQQKVYDRAAATLKAYKDKLASLG